MSGATFINVVTAEWKNTLLYEGTIHAANEILNRVYVLKIRKCKTTLNQENTMWVSKNGLQLARTPLPHFLHLLILDLVIL